MTRRALLPLALVALLLSPTATAQDAATRAAVAPAQTIYDAAAQVMTLAMREADRDGTPDEAEALRDQLVAFGNAVRGEVALSPSATHRELTLQALDTAAPLPLLLQYVLDDVARVATSTERCANGRLTAHDAAGVMASRLYIQATARQVLTLANATPPPLDATRLEAAASAFHAWGESFAAIRECKTLEPVDDLLFFEARPNVIWPTGNITLRGVTTEEGEVHLSNPQLGLDVRVPVVNGSFATGWTLPLETPHGQATLVATLNDLEARSTIQVAPMTSRLVVTGPDRAVAGADINLTLRLTSAMPVITQSAILDISGDANGSLALVDSTATYSFAAHEEAGLMRLVVRYPGSHVVAASEATYMLMVVPAVEGDADPLQARLPDLLVKALGLLALLLVLFGLGFLTLRRRRRQGPAARTETASASSLSSLGWRKPTGLLVAVSAVVRLLRQLRLVRPGTTLREMTPLLSRWSASSPTIVTDFERARYGRGGEDAAASERAAPWFREVTSRLKEERS